MNPTRHSKKLSWLLRHGAREAGLAMDPAGWASVADVLRLSRLTEADLDQCVASNLKQRFQREGARVRATQGHSPAGTPVTADALEASWVRHDDRTAPLFHGTSADRVGPIAQSGGLQPMARTHVHLADAPDSVVGKRHRVGVLLEIDTVALRQAGHAVFCSPNGVWLVRQVPWACVRDLHLISASARRQSASLRSWLVDRDNSC